MTKSGGTSLTGGGVLGNENKVGKRSKGRDRGEDVQPGNERYLAVTK